jgi:hypothetical protein
MSSLLFRHERRLGLKSGQSDRRRNFVVSNKGAFRRSNLILFVLVLGGQNFIEDERDEYDDEYDEESGSCRASGCQSLARRTRQLALKTMGWKQYQRDFRFRVSAHRRQITEDRGQRSEENRRVGQPSTRLSSSQVADA